MWACLGLWFTFCQNKILEQRVKRMAGQDLLECFDAKGVRRGSFS